MKLCKTWKGTYKHINFEILHHGIDEKYQPKGIWCFYLFFPLDQFPPELKKELWLKDKTFQLSKDSKKRISHDYYNSYFGSLENWAGGCTYYSKEGDKFNKVAKFGCDYNHSWNEGNTYDETYLNYDIKLLIDEIHTKIKNIKKVCNWCGLYKSSGKISLNSFTCCECVRIKIDKYGVSVLEH
jgi:hypothetical protein